MDEASYFGTISSIPVPLLLVILDLSLVKLDFKIAMSELIKLNLLLSIDPSLDFVGENLLYFKLALCCSIRLLKS